MIDCTIKLNTMLAWLGWALALVCEIAYLLTAVPGVGVASILCAAAGATMHVRGFVERLDHRERNAYELGQESVRSIR